MNSQDQDLKDEGSRLVLLQSKLCNQIAELNGCQFLNSTQGCGEKQME